MAEITESILPWAKFHLTSPLFTRSEVAKLLNCTPLTVRNREKSGKYPEPQRKEASSHRYYTVQDVLTLQYITFSQQLNISSIISLLWDKKYKDATVVLSCIEAEIITFRNNIVVQKQKQTS